MINNINFLIYPMDECLQMWAAADKKIFVGRKVQAEVFVHIETSGRGATIHTKIITGVCTDVVVANIMFDTIAYVITEDDTGEEYQSHGNFFQKWL